MILTTKDYLEQKAKNLVNEWLSKSQHKIISLKDECKDTTKVIVCAISNEEVFIFW